MSGSSKRWVVGLTGGIGCGKSEVAAAFSILGARIVDADAISRSLTGPNGAAIPLIRGAFGPEVIAGNATLDRAAMRARILADPMAKRKLEDILHPMIRAEVERAIMSLPPDEWGVVEIPLLFESLGYRNRFSRVVAVDCPVELQRQRVRHRSGLSDAEIDALMAAQVPRALRLQLADDVLVNTGTLGELPTAVRRLAGRWSISGPKGD